MVKTSSALVFITSGTLNSQQLDYQSITQIHQLYSNFLVMIGNSLSQISIYIGIITILVAIGAVVVPIYMGIQMRKITQQTTVRIDAIEQRNNNFMLTSQQSILRMQFESMLNDMSDAVEKKDNISTLYYLLSAVGRSLAVNAVTPEMRNTYLQGIEPLLKKLINDKINIKNDDLPPKFGPFLS